MTKTILVVEDDAVARAGLAAILEENGYAVRTAANAGDAIRELDAPEPVDLVLLDMMLRGSDGWQVFAARRKGSAAAVVPVIVVTGLPVAGDGWAKELGAAALLQKPLDVPALLAAVGEHVR